MGALKQVLVFGLFWGGAVAISGAAARAQDVVFHMQETEACIARHSAESGTDNCVGESADRCIEESDRGLTTMVHVECYGHELEAWDQRLNTAYTHLMEQEKSDDAAGGKALRDMQRAWLKFAQTRCDYESAPWVGGTGIGPAAQKCWMEMTGRQALFLEQKILE